MKWVFLLIGILKVVQVQAELDPFSKRRMEAFYDVFLPEQRAILEGAGIVNPHPVTPVPPPNPPPPDFVTGYLPFVLVNNSTLSDSSVNIVVTGDLTSDHNTFVFVKFDSNGIGQLVDMVTGDNSDNYSHNLTYFPYTSEGNRVIYLPEIDSARLWISMNQALNMPVIAGNKLQEPNFTNPNDVNYAVNFDKFEFSFEPSGTEVTVNATAVDFFSIPIYLYASGATSTNSNTGLYQPRSYCMSAAADVFSTVPTSSEWNKLFLRQNGSILRLCSTGKAMTATPVIFDTNYLDDASTYGYSYINSIWSNLASFYRHNPLALTIPVTGNPTYTGTIQSDNSIIFDDGHGNTVTFQHPSPPNYTPSTFTTTGQIFSAEPLYDQETIAGTGVQVSKLFEEAIIAGLIPTANTLSNDYLTAHQADYYTINPNLTSEGQSTGPWYDVYSKAIHSLGSIYSFGFDEPLWPDVAVNVETFIEDSTYIGVTIGSIK